MLCESGPLVEAPGAGVVWASAGFEHQPLAAHRSHCVFEASFQLLADAGSLNAGIDAHPVEVPAPFGQTGFPKTGVRSERASGLDAEQRIVTSQSGVEHFDRNTNFGVGECAALEKRLLD